MENPQKSGADLGIVMLASFDLQVLIFVKM